MLEILSPAGSMDKLKTAFYFGADACYFAGKKFGLRAFADNFTNEEIKLIEDTIKKYNKSSTWFKRYMCGKDSVSNEEINNFMKEIMKQC